MALVGQADAVRTSVNRSLQPHDQVHFQLKRPTYTMPQRFVDQRLQGKQQEDPSGQGWHRLLRTKRLLPPFRRCD